MDPVIQTYVTDLVGWLVAFVPNLVKAILIAVAGWFAGKWSRRAIRKAAERLKWDVILWGYVGTFVRYMVMIVFFTSALNAAGFPVGSLLATFGISGVIIGLRARQAVLAGDVPLAEAAPLLA